MEVAHHSSVSFGAASVASEESPCPPTPASKTFDYYRPLSTLTEISWSLSMAVRVKPWKCHSEEDSITCCAAKFKGSKVECISVKSKVGMSDVIIQTHHAEGLASH